MSVRHTVVVAGGGLAREVISLLNEAGREAVAVVDDDERMHGRRVGGVPVVGGLAEIVGMPDADVVICAGNGGARRLLASRLRRLGVTPERFRPAIHPTVTVPDSCSVGPGSILLAGVVLTADVILGRCVVAMPHAVFTHDVVVGDYATVCAGVALGGGVQVGKGAYLGMNSSIRQNVTVGVDAVLGMGAVLLTDLPAGETWLGVPAELMRRLPQHEGEQS
jgi:sugar O-acyltransferase (sialic acid O-acetyltransferase NeuD family)